MADDEDLPDDEVFEEEAEIEEDPEELEPEELDEEFEALDEDDESFPDGELDGDALDTDDDDDDEQGEVKARPRRGGEDEDEDEDLLAPDDVEADLDTILKDRLVSAEEAGDEEEEEVETDDRGNEGDRLQPKRPDEQLCSTCFLLVRRNAPNCPVGDDSCPLFS